jgi:hypothetical protein
MLRWRMACQLHYRPGIEGRNEDDGAGLPRTL